jgi:hypothetical protein
MLMVKPSSKPNSEIKETGGIPHFQENPCGEL